MIEELRKILRWVEKEYPKKVEKFKELGLENPEELAFRFEWHEVGVNPRKLTKLVEEGFLKIVYKSRSHTEYQPDVEKIKEYVGLLDGKVEDCRNGKKDVNELFGKIVGYEDVKKALRMMVETDEQVHCLLIGPPATAKTLFLEDIYAYYGEDAEFVIGSQASSAGLAKLLMERKPKVLIIDEIDKILKSEDLSVLLSVMERGYTRRVKGDYTTDMEVVRPKVFAAGNRDNLPSELKSRFKPFIFYFKLYSKKQFIQVCVNYMKDEYGEELVREVAEKVWEMMKDEADVRAVRNLLKLSNGKTDRVEFLLELVSKYGIKRNI